MKVVLASQSPRRRELLEEAGSYAIQAGGGEFVDHYDGPLDNIIGLPVAALFERFPDMKP